MAPPVSFPIITISLHTRSIVTLAFNLWWVWKLIVSRRSLICEVTQVVNMQEFLISSGGGGGLDRHIQSAYYKTGFKDVIHIVECVCQVQICDRALYFCPLFLCYSQVISYALPRTEWQILLCKTHSKTKLGHMQRSARPGLTGVQKQSHLQRVHICSTFDVQRLVIFVITFFNLFVGLFGITLHSTRIYTEKPE